MWDGVDRRRTVRAEYPCLITLRKQTPPQAILCHTVDISIFGVRVVTAKKVEIMTEVDLEIDLKDTLPSVASKGVVRWANQLPKEETGKSPQYIIGVQFTDMDEECRRRIQKIVEHLWGKSKK